MQEGSAMMGRIDDRTLQQLVDGELDEQSYRETLIALADDPDGWRRCALAFLEDQLLRRQLVCQPREDDEPATVAAFSSARTRAVPLLLAVAASFMLAFFGGYELNQWHSSRSADRQASAMKPPSFQDNSAFAATRDNQIGSRVKTASDPVGSLHLVMDGPDGATGQTIELPVYPLDANSSQWLVDNRSSFPAQMFDELERTGQEVRRSKFWAPVNLQDGRQLVIPVEQIEITPISRPY
jgi:hypothetical protein